MDVVVPDGRGEICSPGGKGLLFPLGDGEHEWPDALRATLYAMALIYLFLGVNIISDKFMSAIEVITATTKTVIRDGKKVDVKVWNDTVANLTLMALGSSAPEILLSVVEVIFVNEFHAGVLGPSTITGSAAFNLFVIIGVCVYAIPDGETRSVKQTAVFGVTAAFSLFAYFWLLLIVQVFTPDVVTVVEGLLTLALMPVLVLVSYLTDIGAFSFSRCSRPRRSSQVKPHEQAAEAAETGLMSPAARKERSEQASGEIVVSAVAEPNGESAAAVAAAVDSPRGPAAVAAEGSPKKAPCNSWRQEILDAIFEVGGDDDDDDKGEGEGEAPSKVDVAFHVLSVPWKLLWACIIPPAEYAGGWLCFCGSLMGIGGVTAIIIDFAELFGCVTGVPDSVTAITFVALGTSMPDLFASWTAAMKDDTADASIVNVTGSNSVNVFMGIGLPWSLAAIYWRFQGKDFVVPAGDLAFGVVVFSTAALVAIGLLAFRRSQCGGELGGAWTTKMLSSVLLFLLWIFYLVLSIWKALSGDVSFGQQFLALGAGVFALENVVLACGLSLLYVSRRSAATAPAEDKAASTEPAVSVVGRVRSPDGSTEAPLHGVVPAERTRRVSLRHISLVCLASVRLRRLTAASSLAAEPKCQPQKLSLYSAALVCLAVKRFMQRRRQAGVPPSLQGGGAARFVDASAVRDLLLAPGAPKHSEGEGKQLPSGTVSPVDSVDGESTDVRDSADGRSSHSQPAFKAPHQSAPCAAPQPPKPSSSLQSSPCKGHDATERPRAISKSLPPMEATPPLPIAVAGDAPASLKLGGQSPLPVLE